MSNHQINAVANLNQPENIKTMLKINEEAKARDKRSTKKIPMSMCFPNTSQEF